MNWGKGIITGMIIFMIFILSMCIYMFRMPTDEYDHQYYEKGLNFDQDFNKESQVTKDHAKPAITIGSEYCTVTFIQQAKGTIRLIRPSSEAMDKVLPINTDNKKQVLIPIKSLVAGRWQIILEWQSLGKSYLYQQEVTLK